MGFSSTRRSGSGIYPRHLKRHDLAGINQLSAILGNLDQALNLPLTNFNGVRIVFSHHYCHKSRIE